MLGFMREWNACHKLKMFNCLDFVLAFFLNLWSKISWLSVNIVFPKNYIHLTNYRTDLLIKESNRLIEGKTFWLSFVSRFITKGGYINLIWLNDHKLNPIYINKIEYSWQQLAKLCFVEFIECVALCHFVRACVCAWLCSFWMEKWREIETQRERERNGTKKKHIVEPFYYEEFYPSKQIHEQSFIRSHLRARINNIENKLIT